MVLFACGSRSTRSVGCPLRDSAAARLMAVVVLPHPPFWFAIATIIGSAWMETRVRCGHDKPQAGQDQDRSKLQAKPSVLHLVFAHVVGVEALEPLLQALRVPLVRREVDGLRMVDDAVFD